MSSTPNSPSLGPRNALRPSPRKTLAAFAALALIPGIASAKGILVRFLRNPASDSVARYEVFRSAKAGELGTLVGVAPGPGNSQDTIAFADRGAAAGQAFAYSVRAIGKTGVPSEPSAPTWAASPRLSLPDTLRPAAGKVHHYLAPEADPLRGRAVVSYSLADSSRISLAYDSFARRLVFTSRSGRADTARCVVRGAYFRKFQGLDTVVVMVPSRAVSKAAPPREPALQPLSLRLRALPGMRIWSLEGVPAGGEVEIHGLLGQKRGAFQALGTENAPSRVELPAGACGISPLCLLLIRDEQGRIRESMAAKIPRD